MGALLERVGACGCSCLWPCCSLAHPNNLFGLHHEGTGLPLPSCRFAVLPDDADLAPLRHALQLLGPLLPAPAAAAAPSGGAAGAAGSRGAGSSAAAASQQQQQEAAQPARQPQRQQRERVWEAPRERNTQVRMGIHVQWACNHLDASVGCASSMVAALQRPANLASHAVLTTPNRLLPRPQVLLPTSVERDVPEWFFQRVSVLDGLE